MRSRLRIAVTLLISLTALSAIPCHVAQACNKCGHKTRPARCQACGETCCEERLVCKTIYVQTKVVEMKLESRVVREMKQQEETYTAFKRVPKKQKFVKEKCVLEQKVETKEITEKNCKLVMNPGRRDFKVNVYDVEEYCESPCDSGCDCDACAAKPGCPSNCQCPKRVAHKQQEMRSKCIKRPQLVFEETTKDIHFCVKNPTKREDFCAEEIVYELVPVKKTRTVNVCVPRIEAYPVPVTKMKKLPKQILCCEKCCKHYK